MIRSKSQIDPRVASVGARARRGMLVACTLSWTLVIGCGSSLSPQERETLIKEASRRSLDQIVESLNDAQLEQLAIRVADRLRDKKLDQPAKSAGGAPANPGQSESIRPFGGVAGGEPRPQTPEISASPDPVPVAPPPALSSPALSSPPMVAPPMMAPPTPPAGRGPADETIVVRIDGAPHSWSRIKQLASYKANSMEGPELKSFVLDFVKYELLATHARELGMTQDPEYLKRLDGVNREFAARALFSTQMTQFPPLDDARLRQEYESRRELYSHRENALVREFKGNTQKSLEELRQVLDEKTTFEQAQAEGKVPAGITASDVIKVRPGQYPLEVFQEIKNLEPRQLSQPRSTNMGGLMMIRLIQYVPEHVDSFEDVKEGLKKELEGSRVTQVLESVERLARNHVKVVEYPDRLDQTQSETILAEVGSQLIRRDDLHRELAAIPETMRTRFVGENGFKELYRKVVQKALFARYAFDVDPQFKVVYATALGDLAQQELVKIYIERHIMVRARPKADDVKSYYESHQGEYAVDQVHTRNISMRTARAEDRAAALERTRAALARLTAGEPFEDVARTASEDSGTRLQGGDMGWLDRDRLMPPILSAVDALDQGEITHVPVLVPGQAFHILKLDGTRKRIPLEEVALAIERALAVDVQKTALEKTVTDLKIRWPVEIYWDLLPIEAALPAAQSPTESSPVQVEVEAVSRGSANPGAPVRIMIQPSDTGTGIEGNP